MNNPFLSDRNIFSKVVNPLKKKEEKPNDPIKPPEPKQTGEAPNPFRNDRAPLGQPKSNPFATPVQKVTFGIANDEEKRMGVQRQNLGVVRQTAYEPEQSESETHEIYNYAKGDTVKFPLQNDSNAFDRQRASRQNDILSPPQEQRFEEFRKINNLNDCSPIPQQPRMADSEFLNIDALGEDLNRFLAESKNQEELCKILGIERTNKKEQQQTNNRDGRRALEDRPRPANPFDSKANPFDSKTNAFDSKAELPPPRVQQNQSTQDSHSIMPRVPAIFSKERKVDTVKAEQYAPGPNKEEIFKPSQEHVPTFNYAGLHQEPSTVSQQEEEMNYFSAGKGAKSKASESSEVEQLQVFNYSVGKAGKGGESLEEILGREMIELSVNGKYRTFLSASEKIITVKCRMECL